jgi:hypothetical protein
MSAVEAAGARFILGTPLGILFEPLISDSGKTASATEAVLFHPLRGEDPLVTGRHFYRV